MDNNAFPLPTFPFLYTGETDKKKGLSNKSSKLKITLVKINSGKGRKR